MYKAKYRKFQQVIALLFEQLSEATKKKQVVDQYAFFKNLIKINKKKPIEVFISQFYIHRREIRERNRTFLSKMQTTFKNGFFQK